MPTQHYTRIRSFMEHAGQDTPQAPCMPDADTRLLRAKLILEEALETVSALGISVSVADETGNTLLIDEDALTFEADQEPDMEEIVDGCADISVVTMGTLIAMGIDDEPILQEVDAANLRKFAPGSYRRDDGKWMKPPGWEPPAIIARLQEQGWTSTSDLPDEVTT